jgi:hypothetical protein
MKSSHDVLLHFGLSDVEASAALHYIADRLVGGLNPPAEALPIFHRAYRSGIRDCCDALRREAGDTGVETADVFPDLEEAA